MRFIKLGFAALLTAVVCLTGLYFFDHMKFYWFYRCLRYAPSLASCYQETNLDFTVDFYEMKYEGNTKTFVDRYILFLGAYEKPILYFLRDTMHALYGGHGVFVDVGANTGQHSMFMSRYAKEVHAFEPYKLVLDKFRKMVKMNQLNNIAIYPVGLGNENTKKRFYKPPDINISMGSFVEGFKEENSPYEELEIQKGDDAFQKAGVSSVSLIKMDIEGYEKLALQGLRRTLTVNRPTVVFEISLGPNNPVGFKSREDLLAVFPDNYGFLVFRQPYAYSTGAYQLIEINRQLRFDVESQYDVVAYPIEKARQLPRGSSP